MNSILSELKSTRTGRIFAGKPDVVAEIAEKSVPTGIPSGFGELIEHRLRLNLGVNYTCNDAQYRDARKNAEIALGRLLFKDVLLLVDQIAVDCYGQDYQGILEKVRRLRKLMDPSR